MLVKLDIVLQTEPFALVSIASRRSNVGCNLRHLAQVAHVLCVEQVLVLAHVQRLVDLQPRQTGHAVVAVTAGVFLTQLVQVQVLLEATPVDGGVGALLAAPLLQQRLLQNHLVILKRDVVVWLRRQRKLVHLLRVAEDTWK